MSFLSRLNVPSPLTVETRRRLSENDRNWHIKLAFRSAAIILSLIAFSLFAAAIPTWNANFFHVSGPNEGDWQDGMPIAALLTSFLFNIYSVLTILLIPLPRPHPIVNIVFSFLVWGLLIPSITFAAWGGLFEVWRPAIKSSDGKVFCNVLNNFARECNPVLYSVGGLELGGVILSCFVWIAEVGLFVLGVLEVIAWRRGGKIGGSSDGQFTRGQGRFVELGDRDASAQGGFQRMDSDNLALLKETGMLQVEVPKKSFGRGPSR